MPTIADLIAAPERDGLARLRVRLGQHQDPEARRAARRAAAAAPVPPTMPSRGIADRPVTHGEPARFVPVPPVIFDDGTCR